MASAMSIQKNLPSQRPNADFANASSKMEQHGEDLPDFKSLMATSSAERMQEIENEKSSMGANGELNLGESKTDREFKDMLQKVTGKKQDGKKNKLEKEDYLNLMVAQLKNQDPMKPMDNQEMATQLAQFNTVEQLIGVNKTLESMNKAQTEAKVDKLAPYLGRDIEVSGDKIRVSRDHKVSGARFDIPAASGSTTLSIKDSAGKTIRNLTLGGLPSGEHKVDWDGLDDSGLKVPDGQYTYSVNATTQDGKPLKATQTFVARVDSITDLSSGGKLGTSSGPIDMKDVLAIRAPQDDTPKAATFAPPPMSAAGAANKTAAPGLPVAGDAVKPGAQTPPGEAQTPQGVTPADAMAAAAGPVGGPLKPVEDKNSAAAKEQRKQARAEREEAKKDVSKPAPSTSAPAESKPVDKKPTESASAAKTPTATEKPKS